MLSDLAILRNLQSLYNGDASKFDYISTTNGDSFAILSTPDAIHIMNEGSHDLLNWWYNFQAIMIHPPELKGAGVEQGMWINILRILATIESQSPLPKDKPIFIEGHSRGAGEADAMMLLLACRGYTLLNQVSFGRPNSVDAKGAEILAPFPNRSYWNYHNWLHHDPVGNNPPHLAFPFTQSSNRSKYIVDVAPAEDDRWGDLLGWHHLAPNYDTGLQGIFPNG